MPAGAAVCGTTCWAVDRIRINDIRAAVCRRGTSREPRSGPGDSPITVEAVPGVSGPTVTIQAVPGTVPGTGAGGPTFTIEPVPAVPRIELVSGLFHLPHVALLIADG